MKKIVILIVTAIIIDFIGAWIVLMGWNAAREMWPTLPQANFWQAFWICSAISIMFKAHINQES